MNSLKYNLVYSSKAKKYVLVKSDSKDLIDKGYDVIWAFGSQKLDLAKKLLKNMNLADKMDKASPAMG